VAELVDAARLGTVITGKDECRNFLETVVEKLWERIESQLNPFSREIIAITALKRSMKSQRFGTLEGHH